MKKIFIIFMVGFVSSVVWATSTNVQLVKFNNQRVMSVTKTVADYQLSSTLREIFIEVEAYIHRYGYQPAGAPFTRILQEENGYVTAQAGYPVSIYFPGTGQYPIKDTYLPGGLSATTTHVGSYDYISQAYGRIELWMDYYGYFSVGAPWEVYIDDPEVVPESQLRTQIVWPCSPIAP